MRERRAASEAVATDIKKLGGVREAGEAVGGDERVEGGGHRRGKRGSGRNHQGHASDGVFNTDKNHSVVQTYNETIYKHCDYNDADDDNTTEWSAGEPAFDNAPVTLAVPLLKEGLTYFFSGNYDGEQCQHGQQFKITVVHGQGLPPSLRPPSESAPAPNAADVVDTVPDTVVPSNFDNPKETSDDGDVKATSEAPEKGRIIGLELAIALMSLLVFG